MSVTDNNIISSFGTISEDKFKVLSQRSAQVLDKEGCLDERITKIVRQLNTLSDIVTVWSCSGHTEEEYKARGSEVSENRREKSHVIFCITEKGFNHLKLLSEIIKEYIDDFANTKRSMYRPHLKQLYLRWCFDDCISDEWYPVWEIELYGGNFTKVVREAKQFWDYLYDKIKEVKNNGYV